MRSPQNDLITLDLKIYKQNFALLPKITKAVPATLAAILVNKDLKIIIKKNN